MKTSTSTLIPNRRGMWLMVLSQMDRFLVPLLIVAALVLGAMIFGPVLASLPV
jgi:hypothetical protein